MTRSDIVKITLELEPCQAAGLLRFADKVYHADAMAVLYTHVSKDIRDEQASQIMAAFSSLDRALQKAGIASWPWIETGQLGSKS